MNELIVLVIMTDKRSRPRSSNLSACRSGQEARVRLEMIELRLWSLE